MCKRYLLGALSPKENYQVDNHLLENDFFFEAMDGLEQVPWQQSEKHLEETESRIIKEFSINKGQTVKKNLAWTGLGLFMASLLGIWYFNNSDPTDFTQRRNEATSKAPTESTAPTEQQLNKDLEREPETSTSPTIPLEDIATIKTPEQIPTTKPSPIVARKKPQVNQTPDNSNTADKHITVGRIVDTEGLAIPFAVVTSGSASDTTDVSGYFALKVAILITLLLVTHLGVPYPPVEIDTNQNWQIILDVANKSLLNYHPINAANRFK